MADILIGNVKGPQGIPGETGATGAPGAAGADGAAATVNVGTVSTVAYGTPASVTNSGTEAAAVLDFVIPQGKPGEETTRMSGLTLDQITAQSATYPIPAVGESGATIWGKVVKFFTDIKNAVNTKLSGADCVTVLTSTETQKPLAASAGKALNNALATLDGKRTWKAIQGGASPNTNYPVPTDYREVYVTVLFPSGQRLGQIIPKIGSGGQGVAMRQDIGFYYSAAVNGSFAAVFNSETNNVLVYTPWRNGTELSSGYSINIYGR